MSERRVPDLAVVGLGPSGRALAHRAATAGLDVVAVDPAPDRCWTPTYAAWADELPSWLGSGAIAAGVARPTVWTRRARTLDREYSVLDNAGLRNALDLTGVRVVRGRAQVVGGGDVTLDDGTTVGAGTVVDARGLIRSPALAEQTAYGVVLPRADALPALGGAAALFMDWRRDNGAPADASPSFLYAVPLDGERVLFEETCLVGRPALPLPVLRARLRARLAARGVAVPANAPAERVRFPVQAPRPAPGTVTFGARAGLSHPGTGYSVAASLAAVDAVVDALVAGDDPVEALWPRPARAVRALREVGLRALLALPPARVPEFFDSFFALPQPAQRAYLSDRTDPRAVSATMWTLFRRAPMPVRRTLIGATLPIHPRRPR
ncbi:lycopene cyclase family protein [Rhodococcus sp. NPDC004095]